MCVQACIRACMCVLTMKNGGGRLALAKQGEKLTFYLSGAFRGLTFIHLIQGVDCIGCVVVLFFPFG